jgi:hypothetical protein
MMHKAPSLTSRFFLFFETQKIPTPILFRRQHFVRFTADDKAFYPILPAQTHELASKALSILRHCRPFMAHDTIIYQYKSYQKFFPTIHRW